MELRPFPRRCRLFATLTMLFVVIGGTVGPQASSVRALAEVLESFEGPEPTWSLAEADCHASILVRQRQFRDAARGSGCEFLRVGMGQGTKVHLVHEIPPAPVIAELGATMWVKSDRSGLQMLARVVLPRSLDDRTGRPITTFISGTSYQNVGRWQQLTLVEPTLSLERHVRVLTNRIGRPIDARQAFIDLIVINAHGGANVTNLWIDDLEIQGRVESTMTREPLPVYRAPAGRENSPLVASLATPTARQRIRLQGSILTAGDKPLIVRAARPTTQSLAALKTLGFNTVQLNAPPTPEILAEAGRLDLWLIAPPPATMLQDDESDDAAPSANRALGSASSSRASSPTPLESSLTPPPSRSKAFDGVLAWNLGDCLTAQHVAPAKRLAANLRRADRDAGRPVLADVEAGFEQHSRCFDMIVARCWNPRREPDTGEAQLAGDARVAGGTPAAGAIADAMSRLRPGVPVWAALAVPAPFATLDTPILDDRTLADELRHLRQAMYEAIADGARGFVFHLPDDFDPVGPESRDIAGSLQALNAELQLIEPWLAGGAGVEPLVMDSPDWRACVLSTQRARLVVLRRIEPTARGRGSDGRSSHEGRNQNDGRGENDNPIRRASFSSPGSAASTASTASPTSPGRSPTGLSSPIKPTKIGWKPTQLPPKPLVFVDNGATSSVEAYEIDSADLRPVRHQRTAGGVQVTLEQAAPISLVVLTQEPLVVNYLARTLNDRRQAITKGR